jgi:two-component system, NarL family, nitrate/nitrite response regulator NarL
MPWAGQEATAVKILVADDLDLLRDTLAAFLLAEGIATVDVFATLDEVLAAFETGGYDLALIDHNLPGMQGIEGLKKAVTAAAGTPVALMSALASRELAAAAIAAGATGFVPKKMPARSLVAAVDLMAQGETFAPVGLMTPDADAPLALLTRRELQVLRGICDGKSNKEIARDLGLQEVTVKLHTKVLSRKLQARNRTHAAMIARNGGLA